MDEKKIATIAAVVAVIVVVAIIAWLVWFIKSPSPVIEEKGMKKVVSRLKPVIRLDPLKHCEVYKQHGCAHVDGPLCDVETCTMVVENENQKVIPLKVSNG